MKAVILNVSNLCLTYLPCSIERRYWENSQPQFGPSFTSSCNHRPLILAFDMTILCFRSYPGRMGLPRPTTRCFFIFLVACAALLDVCHAGLEGERVSCDDQK